MHLCWLCSPVYFFSNINIVNEALSERLQVASCRKDNNSDRAPRSLYSCRKNFISGVFLSITVDTSGFVTYMLLPWMLSTCLLLSLVSKESGAILTLAQVSSNGFIKWFNRELKQPQGLWQIKWHLKISICAVVAVLQLLHSVLLTINNYAACGPAGAW